jgi:acetyl-CoA carboxylase carboxyl transferase subunit alpha
MSKFGLVDGVIKEPLGGAHVNPDEAAAILKTTLKQTLAELKKIDPDTRIEQRIDKFSRMGFFDER